MSTCPDSLFIPLRFVLLLVNYDTIIYNNRGSAEGDVFSPIII